MPIQWNSGLFMPPPFTGVISFNTRTGAVVLLSSDITSALGFTPENVANKATTFGTVNNVLYPTTQAVVNYVASLPPGGVSSFNTRTGAVVLLSSDITSALGYTPNSGAGSANYIAQYTGTNTQGISPLYTNGTQVSIGTTSLPYLFTVKGSGSYNGGIFADNTGTTGSGQFQVGINGTSIGSLLASGTIYGNTNANLALNATNGIDFFVNGSGTPSVTIGKTTGNPNIGVGVTPVGSAVSSNMEWVNGTQIAVRTLVPQMYISSNITGTPYSPTRYGSGYAMQMVLDAYGGTFNLLRAVSSTAGSAITWLNDLSFDNSGNATFGGNITAVLPVYTSGSYLPVVYNLTTNRFETKVIIYAFSINGGPGPYVNFTATTPATMFNNTYVLALTPTTAVAAAAIAGGYYITGKTTTQFTVNFLTTVATGALFDCTITA